MKFYTLALSFLVTSKLFATDCALDRPIDLKNRKLLQQDITLQNVVFDKDIPSDQLPPEAQHDLIMKLFQIETAASYGDVPTKTGYLGALVTTGERLGVGFAQRYNGSFALEGSTRMANQTKTYETKLKSDTADAVRLIVEEANGKISAISLSLFDDDFCVVSATLANN